MSTIDDFAKGVTPQNPRTYWAKHVVSEAHKGAEIPSSDVKSFTAKDIFLKQEQKNGLFEKFYNFCKNVTGMGVGSKKVGKQIEEFEKGKITEQDLQKTVSKYEGSQNKAKRDLGLLSSGSVSVLCYFKLKNIVERLRGRVEICGLDALKILSPKHVEKFSKILKSKGKSMAIIVAATAYISGLANQLVMKINRLGSKEFKVENKEQLSKKEYKKEKKKLNKCKRKECVQNFLTGVMNGVLAPIAGVGPAVVGAGTYLLAISGLNYAVQKPDNSNSSEKKSIKKYINTIKGTPVTSALTAATIGVLTFKKAKFSKILSNNINEVVKELKAANLKNPDFPVKKTAYDELESLMLNSEKISSILRDNIGDEQKIKQLTDENIFAVKFLQISEASGNKLAAALKENCPPTRDLESAMKEVNKAFGEGKYEISKLLGVGTIAETYLAKDKSGKEVCIKMLKDGISREKILKDKDAFINLVTGGKAKEKLSKTEEYLVKNIENLCSGIVKEVDFENEMKAAQKLKKFTEKANVVKSIEIKNGMYVMEKASGISLDTLSKYYQLEQMKKFAEGNPIELKGIEEKMAKIRAHSPEFENANLTNSEIKKLLMDYIDVFTEQFSKVNKEGRTIHADIHPGNIFINLDALKSGKGKLFTLIDTGNTIDFTKEQTQRSLKLISYIKNGNLKDVTKCFLDDAILPEKMTQDEAFAKVFEEVKKIAFDKETKIEKMSIDSASKLFNCIARKYDIILNDTQLNLQKAKKSASNSLDDLVTSFINKKYSDDINADLNKVDATTVAMKILGDAMDLTAKVVSAQKVQETKNLLKMSPKEIRANLHNPNMLETNSKDYLTYHFKQGMKTEVPL